MRARATRTKQRRERENCNGIRPRTPVYRTFRHVQDVDSGLPSLWWVHCRYQPPNQAQIEHVPKPTVYIYIYIHTHICHCLVLGCLHLLKRPKSSLYWAYIDHQKHPKSSVSTHIKMNKTTTWSVWVWSVCFEILADPWRPEPKEPADRWSFLCPRLSDPPPAKPQPGSVKRWRPWSGGGRLSSLILGLFLSKIARLFGVMSVEESSWEHAGGIHLITIKS